MYTQIIHLDIQKTKTKTRQNRASGLVGFLEAEAQLVNRELGQRGSGSVLSRRCLKRAPT